MTIEMSLSGFLFLLILVLQIAMAAFGYILEPTSNGSIWLYFRTNIEAF